MNSASIQKYLRPYGKIRSLRGSVIRSTFKRVTAAFDKYDEMEVDKAMQELGLNPLDLKCVYCGETATCWDHLIPAATGGTHQVRNLAPACKPCNTRKGHKTLSYCFEALEDSPDKTARKERLETFAASYNPGDSLLDLKDHRKMDEILDRIHQAMIEADEIVAKSIAKRLAVSGVMPA